MLLVYFFVIIAIVIGCINLPALVGLEDAILFSRATSRPLASEEVFLQNDNFAPVSEQLNEVKLNLLHGELPSDVRGVFCRVGPNPLPSHAMKKPMHWFGE